MMASGNCVECWFSLSARTYKVKLVMVLSDNLQ